MGTAIGEVLQLAFILLGYSVMAILAILVHECGHAAAHLLFGHRIVSIRVGLLSLAPPSKWSWKWAQKELSTGRVLAQLRQPAGIRTPVELFLCISAGPIANILSGLALLPFVYGHTILSALCAWFAIVSSFIAFVQLIPYRRGAHSSDGTKLLWILFSKKRRSQLLFAFGLQLRLEEFSLAVRENRNEDAIRLANDLIGRYMETPGADPNLAFHQKLIKVRDYIEAQRTSGAANQAESAPATISSPTPSSPTR